MFGSRNIPKVAKYAVVIYIFTKESKYDCRSTTAENNAKRLARKMMKKLHQRLLKDKKYDNYRDVWGHQQKFSEWIGTVANDRKEYQEGFGVYLLQCNQAVHEVIHKYAHEYDPNRGDSKKCDFFQEIYEELKND